MHKYPIIQVNQTDVYIAETYGSRCDFLKLNLKTGKVEKLKQTNGTLYNKVYEVCNTRNLIFFLMDPSRGIDVYNTLSKSWEILPVKGLTNPTFCAVVIKKRYIYSVSE